MTHLNIVLASMRGFFVRFVFLYHTKIIVFLDPSSSFPLIDLKSDNSKISGNNSSNISNETDKTVKQCVT
jgi:hypothetical protein